MPLQFNGSTSGGILLTAPAIADNSTVTLPTGGGTLGFVAPSGTIILSATTTPSGYLKCDGSIYSQSSYPALYAAIGTSLSPIATFQSTAPVATNGYVSAIYSAGSYLFTNGTAQYGASSVAVSTNGTSWTSVTSGNSSAGFQFSDTKEVAAYNGSLYVLVATNNTGYGTVMYSSTPSSGFSYASVNGTNGVGTNEIAYGGTSNRFVVAGNLDVNCAPSIPYVYYSTNGSSWTGVNLQSLSGSTSQNIVSIAGYSGGFVAITDTGKVIYSADGASWSDISSSLTNLYGVYRVSYANSKFIVVASSGIYTSTTGAASSWTLVTTLIPSNISKVRWNGTMYAYANSSQAFYSPDLINWAEGFIGGTFINAVLSGTFYGKLSGTNNVYSVASYSYNTSTQFVVPFIMPFLSSAGYNLVFAETQYAFGAAGQTLAGTPMPNGLNYYIKT